MSDSDPTRLNSSVGGDHFKTGPDKESLSDDTEDIFYTSTGKEIPGLEIDRYVDKMNCSYYDALRHFGVDTSYVVKVDEPFGSSERKKRTNLLVANNLGERAVHLLTAISDYQKSVDAEKSMHKLLEEGDEEASDKSLEEMVLLKHDGESEFDKSWYANGRIKRKFDTVESRLAANEAASDFFDLSTNPERTDELTALVGSLEDQKNRAQAKNNQTS